MIWLTRSGGTIKADINKEIKLKIFRFLYKLETFNILLEYNMHTHKGI